MFEFEIFFFIAINKLITVSKKKIIIFDLDYKDRKKDRKRDDTFSFFFFLFCGLLDSDGRSLRSSVDDPNAD